MTVKIIVLQLTLVVAAIAISSAIRCTNSRCRLPDCFCAGTWGPSSITLQNTPQIVVFTFDDAITQDKYEFYKALFTKNRKNPNGCPISATFFVSDNGGTNYNLVQKLYKEGHEIASHSKTHRFPTTWWPTAGYSEWVEEMVGQRKQISKMAKVPESEIRGLRVPFLELGGNTQFQMMKDHGFEYDATFMSAGPYNAAQASSKLPSWPFTLDYPVQSRYCDSRNCPTSSFRGIWEIPLNYMLGLDGKGCSMVDDCKTQNLNTANDALRYLKENFQRHYNSNRAPFGVNMHATWFKKRHQFEGMDRFIQYLVDMDDVYIVTAYQMIQWMKEAVHLDKINEFEPFKKPCNTVSEVFRNSKPKQHEWKPKLRISSTLPMQRDSDRYDEDEYTNRRFQGWWRTRRRWK